MGKYKFYIDKRKNKYVFLLFCNNSNDFPIGISKEYESRKLCNNALAEFREYIKLKKYGNIDNCVIKEETECISRYYFEFRNENNEMIFHRGKPKYQTKYNCKKGIQAVIKNIDAELRLDMH